MLISHRKKFIFIKTVKTAGTSVEVYFEKWCMPEGEWSESHAREEYISPSGIIGHRGSDAQSRKWQNHMAAKTVKEYISPDIWESYFKFTIVRNPFEKVVSDFYFKKFLFDNQNNINDAFFSANSFDISNNELTISKFREWVLSKYFSIDTDKFYKDKVDYMDYYIQYEKLSEGIQFVYDKLAIPFEVNKIPRLKSGIRNIQLSVRNLYDKESIDTVKNAFPWEIEKFKYRFPEL
jgi:hypothetical protein